MWTYFLFVIIAISCLVVVADLSPNVYTVLSVGDGDGLIVKDNSSGDKLRIRLLCIDAPELKQPLGKESKDKLASLVGSSVKLRISNNKETYGRTLAEVFASSGRDANYNLNVNMEMVKTGWAFVYCYYMSDCASDTYYTLQAQAIHSKTGVWGQPMEKPWDYRRIVKGKKPYKDSCPPTVPSQRKQGDEVSNEAEQFDNDEDVVEADSKRKSSTLAELVELLIVCLLIALLYFRGQEGVQKLKQIIEKAKQHHKVTQVVNSESTVDSVELLRKP